MTNNTSTGLAKELDVTYANFTEEAEAQGLMRSSVRYAGVTYHLLEAFNNEELVRDWANEFMRDSYFRYRIRVHRGKLGCYGIYVKEAA